MFGVKDSIFPSLRLRKMWKSLHNDPETSKLLKQIYGRSRPSVSYPEKVQDVSRSCLATNLPTHMDSKSRDDSRDRKPNKANPGVRVPRFRGGTKKAGDKEGPAPIDSSVIMRRKRERQIREEQAANEEKVNGYRPPYIKPIGEDEKRRLAEKFEYGGGKALPEEMTFPAMAIPSEERWKASEAERVARVLRRRKGLHGIVDREIGEENAAEPGPTKNAAPPTNMFDQLASEIEERQQFLLDARATGTPYAHEARVAAEISQRMSQLKRLTPPKGN